MMNHIQVNRNNNSPFAFMQNGSSSYIVPKPEAGKQLPVILFITSYPPRECGIATYSQDLIEALNKKFNQSFNIRICALESEHEKHKYKEAERAEVKYILNADDPESYIRLVKNINENSKIGMVLIQHEFGFFAKRENEFNKFLSALTKPVAVVFHTVLPHPNATLKINVQQISSVAKSIIVMTKSSEKILHTEYGIPEDKITVIPHGTHLVPHSDKSILKKKYNLSGLKVLSTFGLLNSGKSIETTLDALSSIVNEHPDVLFLIIGKTHPTVAKQEGEKYRQMLEAKIADMGLQQYVKFINCFLPLSELLEYLQLTDIYLFTSKDPNQAVSGTFSYAISCGCPVISTPIPHAREVLKQDAGIIIDFENPVQLSEAVNTLLKDDQLRKNISSNALHRVASTAWENAAIAHAMLFARTEGDKISLQYNLPEINLNHIKSITSDFGMIQFSRINKPDIDSGYTLDDNARALIAICQHYELTKDEGDLKYIRIYFEFIKHCQEENGVFQNYVDEQKVFTGQNNSTNLADSNGRAIWALGYLISLSDVLPERLVEEATTILTCALKNVMNTHSTRAMAFTIKGLYYYQLKHTTNANLSMIKGLANRLVQMYRHESDQQWQWFESYLTYANGIVPEAMLCAWLATGETIYKEIAITTFDFLLSKTFIENSIKVISNKDWLHKGRNTVDLVMGGEQPIDVAYTILALGKFYEVFKDEAYMDKMKLSFNWFLGSNDLKQIIYNPCTGGCYDGLEENYVNLNQGAESAVSYLMARLTMEKLLQDKQQIKPVMIEAEMSL